MRRHAPERLDHAATPGAAPRNDPLRNGLAYQRAYRNGRTNHGIYCTYRWHAVMSVPASPRPAAAEAALAARVSWRDSALPSLHLLEQMMNVRLTSSFSSPP